MSTETKQKYTAPPPDESKTKPKGSFLSSFFSKKSTKHHPKDHRGKLMKDGQFNIKASHADHISQANSKDFGNLTSKRSKASKPNIDVNKQELDAQIRLGKFVTVRKRLRAIAAQRRKVQRYIKSIVVFIVFMVVFVMRNSSSDEDLFFSNAKIADAFVGERDFYEINTASDMWDWVSGTLCDTYYGQSTFDGVENEDRDRWLFGTYRKVGGIRVATLRVKKKPCGLASKMFNATDNEKLICYGHGEKMVYDVEAEDTMPYGRDNSSLFTWGGWNDTDAAARRREGWATQIGTYPSAHTYSSPAFGFVLPQTNKNQALSSIQFAKENGYVDFHTRMVMVDFTLVNGQTKSLMTLRMMFAMTKAGGVIPTHEFMQVETEAIDFATTNFADLDQKSLWMLLEFVFYIYFVIEILINMWLDHCKPADPEFDGDVSCLRSNLIYRPWNYWQHLSGDLPDTFQLFNVTFYVLHWALRVYAASNSPREITFDTDKYIPIRVYSETLAYKRYAMVLVVFCVFFRFIFYLAIIPELGVITNALTKSIRAIAGFMGVFIFFTFMFLLAGIQLFGTRLEGFRSLPAAFWTIIQMAMLGENLTEDMLAADRSLVTGFYILMFYIFNTTMLLNMAIAIISDAYAEAREEVNEGKDADVKIGREIKRFVMLRIWHIPFVGSWLKNRYINFEKLEAARIRRAESGNMSLHQQIKLQQKKVEAENAANNVKKAKNKYVTHEARMAKTAAQQTLLELRQLNLFLKQFVLTKIGGGGGGTLDSVEDFLFAHKNKNKKMSFTTSQPSFVVDGVSARNHAVVDVVEVGKRKEQGGKKKSDDAKRKEHGVL